MRRQLAWPIAVPLAVIGMLAGHAVGYRAAVPDAHERAHVLAVERTWLSRVRAARGRALPRARRARLRRDGARRRPRPRRGRRSSQIALVAAFAPLAFAPQELIERYAHDGHVHWGSLASAPFLLGLATQLPFALLAAAIAFALARGRARLGPALGRSPGRAARPTRVRCLSWLGVDLPREPVLARGYAGRGPPLLA